MMKQNMVMIVPQIAMMGWVSYFFAGFVVGDNMPCLTQYNFTVIITCHSVQFDHHHNEPDQKISPEL